jgi:hypothetical protein
MTMTRKDYVMIAETIHGLLVDIDRESPGMREVLRGERMGVASVARRLADQLHSENTRFDRTRFIEACGLTA